MRKKCPAEGHQAGGHSDRQESWAAAPGDLSKLKEELNRNSRKFKTNIVSYMGQTNPMTVHGRADWPGSNSAKEGAWGPSAQGTEHKASKCACGKEGQAHLSLHKQECGQQVTGSGNSSLFGPCNGTSGVITVPESHHQTGDSLHKATKLAGGWSIQHK